MPKLNINAPDGKVLKIDVPEGTDPSKYDSIVDEVISDYKSSGGQAPAAQEGPGTLESGALGLMSGVPGAETALSAIKAIGPTTYEEEHKKLEDLKDQAWNQHPVAYGTGKATGLVGTGLVAPAGIASAVGVGALSGLDTAKTPDEFLKSGAEGAATGGVLGAASKYVAEPAINAVVNKLAPAAKTAVASLGKDLTPADIEAYLKNPEAIRSALTRPEIGEQLANITGDVTNASSHLSNEARGLLNPESNIMSVQNGISDVKAIIDGAKQQYMRDGVVKSGMEPAISALDNELERITSLAKANNGMISEDTLRGVIDDLQGAVKEKSFGNPDVSAKQDALKTLSGRLNDMLRERNAPYAEGMQPAADMAKLSSGLQKKFGLKPDEGTMGVTDATDTKLANVLKEGKTEGADLLDQLKNATGKDLPTLLQNSKIKAAFDAPGAGEGLRSVMTALGYGAGHMSGLPGGGIIGAAGGRFAAGTFNGGQMAQKVLDTYINGSRAYSNSAIKPLLAKFGPVLANAAKAGGTQLAATHFVLSTSNPEYQQLESHINNESSSDTNTGIRNEE